MIWVYRSPSGFIPPAVTVGDLLCYEVSLENEVLPQAWQHASQPAACARWVTFCRSAARRYGTQVQACKVNVLAVLACDGDHGFLILTDTAGSQALPY